LPRGTATQLAGGDLGHADKTMCDIVLCGAAPRGKALRRDGAKAGDGIYVSGRLGGSALGLERQQGRSWARHLRPQPRLKLGIFLRERLGASAAMDLSDGLSLDLHRLAMASRLEAHIEAPPRFPGASLEQALDGGEDYELLFTVAAGCRVPPRFDGQPLTRVGVMRKGRAGDVFLGDSRLPALGYDHFRETR
jgi:thiamine-monophosphate kinase